jgi:hypothetical protein
MSNSGGQYSSYGPPSNPPYNTPDAGLYPQGPAAGNYPPAGNYGPPNNYVQNAGAPSLYPGGQYMPGQQLPGQFQTPRKGMSAGCIVGLVLVVVLAVCGGISFMVVRALPQSTNNSTTNVTPIGVTPTPTLVASPSGNTINADAAQIITDPKLTPQVDKTTYAPVAGTETTQFTVGQRVYVTFTVHPSKYDVSTQNAYIMVRFYDGSQAVANNSDPLVVSKGKPIDAAYYGIVYDTATSNGAAEVYWCRKADCSDGELAQVVYFTVSS